MSERDISKEKKITSFNIEVELLEKVKWLAPFKGYSSISELVNTLLSEWVNANE